MANFKVWDPWQLGETIDAAIVYEADDAPHAAELYADAAHVAGDAWGGLDVLVRDEEDGTTYECTVAGDPPAFRCVAYSIHNACGAV